MGLKMYLLFEQEFTDRLEAIRQQKPSCWNEEVDVISIKSFFIINSLRQAQVAKLVNVVQNLNNITKLDLEGNDLGYREALFIAGYLRASKTLLDLNLYNNKLGAKGTCTLANALTVNNHLTCLDISYNDIGIQGFAVIFNMLQRNSVLMTVKLAMNIPHQSEEELIAKRIKVGIDIELNRNLKKFNNKSLIWARVSAAIAFVRANAANALRFSVLPLLTYGSDLMHYTGFVSEENCKPVISKPLIFSRPTIAASSSVLTEQSKKDLFLEKRAFKEERVASSTLEEIKLKLNENKK
jgi:hypothetical protein